MSELVPASSSSEKITEILNTGLLDLSVEPSIRDIMAGSEFTLFVLIKNPFPVPVWINKVHVNLPSELRMISSINIDDLKAQEKEKYLLEQQEKKQRESLEIISKKISLIEGWVKHSETTDTQELTSKIESVLSDLKEYINSIQITVSIGKSTISRLKISANSALVSLNNTVCDRVEISNPIVEEYQRTRTREVVLESSLPENTALQSGNTVVYSVILNVKNKLLFNPSKYRLQFNANFMFEPLTFCKTPLDNEREKTIDGKKQEKIFTNTIAYELSIRASLSSVITGSMLGGITGGLGRILQLSHSDLSIILNLNNAVAIITAIILSIMAIIFMGRKSDTQSFISVEDFWGGLLVGFLVGYTGTSFFENLTGLRP